MKKIKSLLVLRLNSLSAFVLLTQSTFACILLMSFFGPLVTEARNQEKGGKVTAQPAPARRKKPAPATTKGQIDPVSSSVLKKGMEIELVGGVGSITLKGIDGKSKTLEELSGYHAEIELVNEDSMTLKVFQHGNSNQPEALYVMPTPKGATPKSLGLRVVSPGELAFGGQYEESRAADQLVEEKAAEAAFATMQERLLKVNADAAKFADCNQKDGPIIVSKSLVATSGQFASGDKVESINREDWRCGTTREDALLEVCANAIGGIGNSQNGIGIGSNLQGFRIGQSKNPLKRKWEFDFPNQSKQDTMIRINEYPVMTEMMVFPRTHLPSVVQEGDNMRVTLPNDDTIKISRKDGTIVDGQIKEKSSNKLPPDLEYTGEGILIKVQGREGLNLKGLPGGSLQTAKRAFIMKKGQKDCEVDPTELWPNRREIKGHPQFRFAEDGDFYKWLKTKCNF